MILDSIRNFIMACPYLKTIDSGVNVNYLSDQADTYSINQEPDEIIIKKYVNGDTLREYNFILVSKEIYTDDVMKNIKISSFYEEFLDWLEEQTNKGNLPNLGENEKVIYQIKCKLIYLREGEMK